MAASRPCLTTLCGWCVGKQWPHSLPGPGVRLHGPLAVLCGQRAGTLPLADHVPDPALTLNAPLAELREDLSFEVQPVKILNRQVKKLRRQVIPMVKVLLTIELVKKVTWEPEKSLKRNQPLLIQEQGKLKISRTKFL